MKKLIILIMLCTYFSAFGQNREVPIRFPIDGEKLFPNLIFTIESIPEKSEIGLIPKVKSGTIYLDTLYPARKYTYFHDVIDCDSAYYVSGYTYGNRVSSDYDPNNICLPVRMKIDYSGDVLWSKSDSLMHGDHFVMYNKSIIQLSDGNFLQMCDVRNDYTNWKNYDWNATGYVKFNSNGDTIWTKIYSDTTYLKSCDWGQDIVAEDDGGFTVAALIPSDSKHLNPYDTTDTFLYVDTTYIGIIRYDSLGMIIQRNTFFIGGEKVYKTIGLLMKQDDGGYIIGGVNNFGANLNQYYLLKIDSSFNWQWRKLFGQINYYEAGMNIVKIKNNNYFFSVERADTPTVIQSGQTYYELYYHIGIMDSLFNIVQDTMFWMYMTDTTYQYYQFFKDCGINRGSLNNPLNGNYSTLSNIGGYGANLITLDSNLSFQ